MSCQLCDRDIQKLTAHHLIPRQTVKRKQADSGATIDICSPCHRQIHTLYSNLELAKHLNIMSQGFPYPLQVREELRPVYKHCEAIQIID